MFHALARADRLGLSAAMANVGLEGDAGQSEAEDWGEDSEEEGEDAADETMVQDEGSGQEHKEEDEEDEEDEVHVKRTKKSRKAPKKGNFACGHCSRVFQHKQSLTRHIAGHAKPNGIHDCPLCDKRFNLKQAKVRTHPSPALVQIVTPLLSAYMATCPCRGQPSRWHSYPRPGPVILCSPVPPSTQSALTP